MKKLIILIFIILTTGCDLLNLDDATSSDLSPQMIFMSSISNDNAKVDTLSIKFLLDDSPQEISRATINDSNLSYDSTNKEYSSTISYSENDSYTVICYINEGEYNEEIINDNTLTINQFPTFKIKVASSISNLANATAVDYISSISNTNVIGIVFNNETGYTVNGVVKVLNSISGNESKEYEIKNNWFISNSLLNGEAAGFLPDTLYLEATFSYDGSLNSSFKSGYIRRTIKITKEIQLTNN